MLRGLRPQSPLEVLDPLAQAESPTGEELRIAAVLELIQLPTTPDETLKRLIIGLWTIPPRSRPFGALELRANLLKDRVRHRVSLLVVGSVSSRALGSLRGPLA